MTTELEIASASMDADTLEQHLQTLDLTSLVQQMGNPGIIRVVTDWQESPADKRFVDHLADKVRRAFSHHHFRLRAGHPPAYRVEDLIMVVILHRAHLMVRAAPPAALLYRKYRLMFMGMIGKQESEADKVWLGIRRTIIDDWNQSYALGLTLLHYNAVGYAFAPDPLYDDQEQVRQLQSILLEADA